MKKQESGLPFDDFRNLINQLPEADEQAAVHTLSQMGNEAGVPQTPVEELCTWYSRWSGRSPVAHRPLLTIFGGTHALQNEFDQGANAEWILGEVVKITEGSAVVNRLCSAQEFGLKLFDLALQIPVEDISQEAALDEKGCAGTIAFGMEAIAGGSDLLAVCAIENSVSPSTAAILILLAGLDVSALKLAGEMADRVQQAVSLVEGHDKDGFEVLRRLGGRETAAMAGAILAARTEHIPTVLGGVTALAACVALHRQNPASISHCVFAQSLGEDALDRIVGEIGLGIVHNQALTTEVGGDVLMAASTIRNAFKHLDYSGSEVS